MMQFRSATRFVFLLSAAVLAGILLAPGLTSQEQEQKRTEEKPTISFTFDDGDTNAYLSYELEEWNELILTQLKKHDLKTILFSMGHNKGSQKGRHILSTWNDAGHGIANHTFSHRNFNSPKVTLEDFRTDFLRNDSIIRGYSNFLPLFRFPYLKEGNTAEKIEGFRTFLEEAGYRNGYVTVDASDWYINSRLIKRLTEDPQGDISGFREYYIEHLYGRALYYDSLAFQLTGRRIRHTLLLHHNPAAALFLGDLIRHFREKGWNVIDAQKAYEDEIYRSKPSVVPAGESLIWSLAKESGRFESVLRYPAEDGQYEKERMDELGL